MLPNPLKLKWTILFVFVCLAHNVERMDAKEKGGAKSEKQGKSSSSSRDGTLQAGQEAPDFTLKDLNGKDVTLSSFRGKPVFLMFGSYT